MISCNKVNGINTIIHNVIHVVILIFACLKGSLVVEVRDSNGWFSDGDLIDSFTFTLSSPLNKFNSSNSTKVNGYHGVALLTLNYGNLTADPTSCNSVECTMSSTCTHTHYGNPTAPYQCNSMECPMSSTFKQTHQGP